MTLTHNDKDSANQITAEYSDGRRRIDLTYITPQIEI